MYDGNSLPLFLVRVIIFEPILPVASNLYDLRVVVHNIYNLVFVVIKGL